ncbi:MAG: dihydropteroate synthase [Chloroflexi bacterium]|nr:dihydropteroate synthase [Chloroflexota bacterium]
MLIVGENIHVLSTRVKNAFLERDAEFIQDLAKAQVKAGADMLDLNIGPAKKTGVDTMEWLVSILEPVVDVPFSFDSTNAAAIEAGLKKTSRHGMINSTSADPERIATMMPLAVQYNAKLVALALGPTGLPANADARVELVMDTILPAAEQYGVPMENLYLDPLVLTVSGTQDQTACLVDAVRMFKGLADPAPKTIVGLSNCSNQAPAEIRPLINRTLLVMLMSVGLDAAILDPLDPKMMETIRTIESRDESTPVRRLQLTLFDKTQNMEDLEASDVDMSDEEQVAIFKTVQILQNKIIYAHSYLKM